MNSTDKVIEHTEKWIKSVVIDCNFCPFAAKALFNKSIRYTVKLNTTLKDSLACLEEELNFLETNPEVETSFIIFPNNYTEFNDYLTLVKKTDSYIQKSDFDGIYQIASFHPNYCFAGSNVDDAANYTNRSIYPMLHLLREESITKALKLFPNPELIPHNNIEFARKKGLQYMQVLRSACLS